MNYEFHWEAEQELYEATRRYESKVRGLGRRFAEEVFRVIQILLEHPQLGSRVDKELRHFVLRQFPFSVVYWATEESIHIVAIAHSSREPGYWQLRVQDGQ